MLCLRQSNGLDFYTDIHHALTKQVNFWLEIYCFGVPELSAPEITWNWITCGTELFEL